jgi:TM2 domain-containing membrane protein YozV
MPEQNNKCHPGIAAILSFIFNGLGQLYNGQIKKGLLIILLSSLSMFILLVGSILIGLWLLGKVLLMRSLVLGLVMFAMGLVSICIVGIYSIFDAHRVASKT